MTSLAPRRRLAAPGAFPEVENFLAMLPDGERESFLKFAEVSGSDYETWIYAAILGFQGRFSELEAWSHAFYPRVNRRQILTREVDALEADIAELRNLAQVGKITPDGAATQISRLTKELRGHIAEIERMSKAIDRRGLVLAGADRAIRELRAIFRGNGEIMDALEPAFASVWAVITEEI